MGAGKRIQKIRDTGDVRSHAVSTTQIFQPDLLELLQAVVDYAPVKAIILERDDNQLDPVAIADEIQKLQTFADPSPNS